MVVVRRSQTSPLRIRTKKRKGIAAAAASHVGIYIPTIDLEKERSSLSLKIAQACQEYGFFKVVNHRVPKEVIATMEFQGNTFFAKPASDKQRASAAGPPSTTTPFGYGCKNIGFNGDMGELEYLLLQTNPHSISQISQSISSPNPTIFSCAVNDYIKAVRELACEILDLLAEGLWVSDKTVFSKLIKNVQSDSCFRLNHYPPLKHQSPSWEPSTPTLVNTTGTGCGGMVGFGEHSDPQILTIMRSNDVEGLQICIGDGLWVPVPPDPTEFSVFVGDALQAMTNGRLVSSRHRVMVGMKSSVVKSRMSMMYFGAPPPSAVISPLPELVDSSDPLKPILYKPFTWSEFKNAAYSLRLGDSRLDLFKIHSLKS